MNRIRELREEKNLTQQLLGEKLQTTTKNIYRWENEITEMSSSVLLKIADYFEVSVDYLLGRETEWGTIHAETSLTPEQNELLSLYNRMSFRDKNRLLGFAQGLVY